MSGCDELRCLEEIDCSSDELIVAFASMDGEIVDQHFGSARGFYVYRVSQDSSVFVTKKSFDKEKQDGNEDKLKPKLKWLAGGDLVYCGSIGGSATKQLIALGMQPRVVKEGPEIDEVITELQQEWLAQTNQALVRLIKSKHKTSSNVNDFEEEWLG